MESCLAKINLLCRLTGWRRRGLAMLLGIFAAAALPPCYLLPLLIPSLSGLFLLVLHAPTKRQAFFDGWWWGLGHFTAGLYWICISLYVEPEKFAWLTPFALFGLPSVIAIYIGLVTLALYRLRAQRPATLIMLFAALWVGAEFARSQLFTGFPWNLIGYVWNLSDVTLQPAHLWGIYGQSWLAIFLATMPALFAFKGERARLFNAIGLLLLLGVMGISYIRLAGHPTEYTNTHLRIVQGNIEQSMKFDPRTMLQGMRKYEALTRSPGAEKIDMAIWPETAVPYIVSPDSALLHELASLLSANALLLTGGMRATGEDKSWQAWNSAFVINTKADIIATYDKYHLVPFGEYIPLRHVLPLDAIAGGMGDFSTGPGPQTLTPYAVPPFSPLICYEAIFSGRATDGSGKAKWIANITNDAWFGISSGPYQHLEMARTRAVEEGLPLIRAANTGMSVATDAYGRVLKQLPLGQSGIIDTALPAALKDDSIPGRMRAGIILLQIAVSFCFVYAFNRQSNVANNLVD